MSNNTISMSSECFNIEDNIIRLTIHNIVCCKVTIAVCNTNGFVAPLLKLNMNNILRTIFTCTIYHTVNTFTREWYKKFECDITILCATLRKQTCNVRSVILP